MGSPSTSRVLVTDYVWPNLDVERSVLAAIGAELVVAEGGEEEELRSLARGVDAILTCFKRVSRETLLAADRCRLVSRYGVGVDNIDVSTATELGILVTNVPDYCVDEVSDHALALLLSAARRVMVYDRSVRRGEWDGKVGMPIPRLRGLTLGIIGLGRIGRAVARKASVFGLRIIAYDTQPPAEVGAGVEVTFVDLETLLRESDFITLHAPLLPETTNLINAETLQKMKKSAWLVNTSRGGLVDTKALAQALQKGQIGGAALDVLPQEPPEANEPLRALPNVVLTPHVAFYSEGSLAELERRAAEHVVQVLQGERPIHLVNPQVLQQSNCRLSQKTAP